MPKVGIDWSDGHYYYRTYESFCDVHWAPSCSLRYQREAWHAMPNVSRFRLALWRAAEWLYGLVQRDLHRLDEMQRTNSSKDKLRELYEQTKRS